MRSPLSTAIAIAVGIIILLGAFLPAFLPEDLGQMIVEVRSILLGWAVVLSGVAMLVGIFNLVRVHLHRLGGTRRDYYSAILLIAFAGTFILGLVFTPKDPRFQRLVTAVQEPVEISLLAILAVTLVYASLRMWRRRGGWMTAVFGVSVILFLVSGAGLLAGWQDLPVLGGLAQLITGLPIAGARGILLGVALGSVATGLRILLGADRPYSG